MKTLRMWNPQRGWLLPLSPKDWLPGDQVVHCALYVIEKLGQLAIKG